MGKNEEYDLGEFFATFCFIVKESDEKYFEDGNPVNAVLLDGWDNPSVYAKLVK